MIAGAFLIIGALLGFWFNRLQDNRRANREHEQRWYEDVRTLSAQAVTATREYIHATSFIDDSEIESEDESTSEKFTGAQAAFDRLQALWGELALVAPKRLADAAWKIVETAHDVRVAFYRDESLVKPHARMSEVATEFIDEVRAYLRVDDAAPIKP